MNYLLYSCELIAIITTDLPLALILFFVVIYTYQVTYNPRYGRTLRCSNGELSGAQHTFWLEEHIQRFPSCCIWSRWGNCRASIPDNRKDHLYVHSFLSTLFDQIFAWCSSSSCHCNAFYIL